MSNKYVPPNAGIAMARRASMELNAPMVVIHAFNFEGGQLETYTYGDDREKCAAAKKLGDISHNVIINLANNLAGGIQ